MNKDEMTVAEIVAKNQAKSVEMTQAEADALMAEIKAIILS